MADDRRMLDALRTRMQAGRVSATSLYGTHASMVLDNPIPGGPSSDTDTPTRRKSSALSISHLTSATPVRTVPRANVAPVANQAVRDIARELDAVEARLSAYRQSRDGLATVTEPTSSKYTDTPTPNDVVAEPQADQKAQGKTQQAGEVVDEVEHALANCDRLLEQAKLQSSAASITRSLRTPPPSVRRSGSPMPRLDPDLKDVGVSSRWDTVPLRQNLSESLLVSNPDQSLLELEATAQSMRALAASGEAEMERESAAIIEHNRLAQVSQIRELQRKFESKKKMVLLKLREECESETRAQVKQVIDQYEREQNDAVKTVEDQLLQERERLLNQILIKHQAATEDQVKRTQVQLQSETLIRKQQLEKALEQEFQDQIRELEEETAMELQRWEQKKRLQLESDVLSRREQAAAAILRAQEAKTNELKHQLQRDHGESENDELDKLKKALAFGAQAQLQQLRKQLETAHEQKMEDTRTEAALALEAKLADLKQVLSLSHKQELEKLQRELEKRHRIGVMELHQELEERHRLQINEVTTQANKALEAEVSVHRKKLEEENNARLGELREMLARDHDVKLHQLEMEMTAQCEEALQQVRKRELENQQLELETKLARLQHSKNKLLEEAMMFLTTSHNKQSDGTTNTTEVTLKLQHIGTLLPKELQQVVTTLVRDFEDLVEEQQILVEKIGDTTGLYLTYKRQCAQWEADVTELQATIESLQAQLQTKDILAKKLYTANEALLKKLGLTNA